MIVNGSRRRNLIHVEYHFVTQHDNLDDECQLSLSLQYVCVTMKEIA